MLSAIQRQMGATGTIGSNGLSCKSNPLFADNRTKSALVISLAGTFSSRKTHFTGYEGLFKPQNVYLALCLHCYDVITNGERMQNVT
jgi:hypothetical protein